MAVSIDLGKVLDKAWEDKSLEEVLAAPVSALAGVSEADAEKLSSGRAGSRRSATWGRTPTSPPQASWSPCRATRADARLSRVVGGG